jgi:CheY-like chemotaxis protein
MSDSLGPQGARTPNVYFIDDSATMREVIKIAFRKESMQVIACADAASAFAQFAHLPPDVVITDVIMPDKDGYEVCEFVKQHEDYGKTPVILMSGVVNRAVAEKATAVKADELMRKPFQPHDLIVRVKTLLGQGGSSILRPEDNFANESADGSPRPAAKVLSSLFGAPPSAAVADPFAQAQRGNFSGHGAPVAVAAPPQRPPMPVRPQPGVASASQASAANAELVRLRNELRRLELLVKKLQAELEAEHQYCEALEAHVKTLQES